MRTRIAMAASVAIAVALPAAADAATKTVDMGAPPSAQRSLRPLAAEANAFFPSTVTVRVGDAVRFRPMGFHNADIPERGGTGLPFIVPTGQPVQGAVDAAGAPYWFNGQPAFGLNGGLFAGSFGKTVTYDGTKRVTSGVPTGPRTKPMTVRFTKTGNVTYFCDIHPGMKGRVRVVRRGAKVPTARQDAQRVREQVRRAVATAERLDRTEAPARTVFVGAAGSGGVESFKFFPGRATVSVGDAVTFRMSPGSREAHTATIGPGDIEDATSFLGGLAASFESPAIAPAALYPSDPPPAGPPSFTAASHGNGFWNSGVMDAERRSPLPPSSTVRFAAPGTHTVFCLIHPFMKGTVVVR